MQNCFGFKRIDFCCSNVASPGFRASKIVVIRHPVCLVDYLDDRQ